MVNIPLIQGNSIQDINTSIIAIKKAQKELESLNAFVDNKIKALNLALSGGVGKFIQSISQTEGQIAVEVGELTDTIASGNNQPATSQGVANALSGKVNTDLYTDTNLNTLINTGFYSVGYNENWQGYNFPINHFGTLLVGTTSSGNLMQMFMSDDEQLVYVRNCTWNVWSSWKKVVFQDEISTKVLWVGDCHTVNDVITLNDDISKYGLLIFYVNVIPNRTPNYDIFGGVFPTISEYYEFDLTNAMYAGDRSNRASFQKIDNTHIKCNIWDITQIATYISGLCRVVGILK
jgi:hypothetical protein